MLGDSPGRGKTAQLVGLAAHLKAQGQLGAASGKRALYVVPSTSLGHQTREAIACLCPALAVTDWTDATVKKSAPLGDVVIVTYALLRQRVDSLLAEGFVLIVGDEASALKGAGTTQTAFRQLALHAQRVVMVTATPFEMHALDLHSILAAAGIEVGTRDSWGHALCYVDQVFADGSCRFGSLKPGAAESLRSFIQPWILRREGCLPGIRYPARVGQKYRLVQPTAEQFRQLTIASKHSDPMRAANLAKAAIAFVGEGSRRECAKAVAITSWLLGRPRVDKAIVYSERTDTLDVVESLLTEAAINYVRIDGSYTRSKRLDAVTQFREDASVRVLLGTSVLCRGLNLQFCRVILSHDGYWNPASAEQLEGRVCRPGSPHETYEFLTFLLDHPQDLKRQQKATRRSTEAGQVTVDTSAYHSTAS